MSGNDNPAMPGGCACGAVRYALATPPRRASICHCRMCQRASGSYVLPLANVVLADFSVTKGALALYHSSPLAERGFCAACGSPLTFRYVQNDGISVTIPSLDDPDAVQPTTANGLESRSRHFGGLAALPGTETREAMPADWQAAIDRCGISDGRKG